MNLTIGRKMFLIGKAGMLLADIVPGIQRTAELVQEISAFSSEQGHPAA